MRTAVEFARSWAARFLEVQGVDRGMALAAQAFSALIPLVIVSTAILPRDEERDFADGLIDRFELTGSSAETVRLAFSSAASVEEGVSVLGMVLKLVSAMAFTRGMQRLYEGAHRLPTRGVRASRSRLAWLGLVVYVAVRPLLSGVFEDRVGRVVVSLVLGAFMWTATPYILIGRRVPWRTLVPGALLTAAELTVVALASVIWLPDAIGPQRPSSE